MKNHNNSKLNHILIRSKDQSTLHLKPEKSKDDILRHNNNIESTWDKIKRNMYILSNYKYNSDSIIHYNIINYNFIRPHSSLSKITASRHGCNNMVNMTPAMDGGYPQWFVTFNELLTESWGYDKSFVFKMGPNLMNSVRVGIRNKKTVIISTFFVFILNALHLR